MDGGPANNITAGAAGGFGSELPIVLPFATIFSALLAAWTQITELVSSGVLEPMRERIGSFFSSFPPTDIEPTCICVPSAGYYYEVWLKPTVQPALEWLLQDTALIRSVLISSLSPIIMTAVVEYAKYRWRTAGEQHGERENSGSIAGRVSAFRASLTNRVKDIKTGIGGVGNEDKGLLNRRPEEKAPVEVAKTGKEPAKCRPSDQRLLEQKNAAVKQVVAKVNEQSAATSMTGTTGNSTTEEVCSATGIGNVVDTNANRNKERVEGSQQFKNGGTTCSHGSSKPSQEDTKVLDHFGSNHATITNGTSNTSLTSSTSSTTQSCIDAGGSHAATSSAAGLGLSPSGQPRPLPPSSLLYAFLVPTAADSGNLPYILTFSTAAVAEQWYIAVCAMGVTRVTAQWYTYTGANPPYPAMDDSRFEKVSWRGQVLAKMVSSSSGMVLPLQTAEGYLVPNQTCHVHVTSAVKELGLQGGVGGGGVSGQGTTDVQKTTATAESSKMELKSPIKPGKNYPPFPGPPPTNTHTQTGQSSGATQHSGDQVTQGTFIAGGQENPGSSYANYQVNQGTQTFGNQNTYGTYYSSYQSTLGSFSSTTSKYTLAQAAYDHAHRLQWGGDRRSFEEIRTDVYRQLKEDCCSGQQNNNSSNNRSGGDHTHGTSSQSVHLTNGVNGIDSKNEQLHKCAIATTARESGVSDSVRYFTSAVESSGKDDRDNKSKTTSSTALINGVAQNGLEGYTSRFSSSAQDLNFPGLLDADSCRINGNRRSLDLDSTERSKETATKLQQLQQQKAHYEQKLQRWADTFEQQGNSFATQAQELEYQHTQLVVKRLEEKLEALQQQGQGSYSCSVGSLSGELSRGII